MDKDTELFKAVNVEMQDTLESYVAVGPLGNEHEITIRGTNTEYNKPIRFA